MKHVDSARIWINEFNRLVGYKFSNMLQNWNIFSDMKQRGIHVAIIEQSILPRSVLFLFVWSS